MIYTITLNPSIDYMVQLDEFTIGEINRSREDSLVAGGKGINVSLMLHLLKVDTCAIAIVAGDTGQFIESYVKKTGCPTDFIILNKGFSRINVKITAKESTAINGIGPLIEVDTIARITDSLQDFSKGDALVLAGSIPSTAPQDTYVQLLTSVVTKRGKIVVDASGQLLESTLAFHPFLIKPNTEELGELFNVTITEQEDIIKYAHILQTRGARNILVSRGSRGSLLLTETGQVYGSACVGKQVVNAVGCGDAMVAGFLAGYEASKNYEKAYALAIATSSAKALFGYETAFDHIEAVLKKVAVYSL